MAKIKKTDRGYEVNNIVFVRRKKTHNSRGQDEEASIKKLGAILREAGPLRGLSNLEEKKYFPDVLGIQPSDPSWSQVTRNYWNNVSKAIEAGSGLKLEIGFLYDTKEGAEIDAQGDTSKSSDDCGAPINVAQWILWKFAVKHPRVANTIDDVNKSAKIWFYLYSKSEALKKEETALNLKDKSVELYVKHLGKLNVMRQVLWITGRTPINLTDGEVRIAFENLAQESPAQFIGIVSDKNLEMKVFIEQALNAEHLKKIENTDTFYYGETHNVIGNGIDDIVAFFKSGSVESKRLLNDLKVKLKIQDVVAAPAAIRKEKIVDENVTKPETGQGSITGVKASEKETVKA